MTSESLVNQQLAAQVPPVATPEAIAAQQPDSSSAEIFPAPRTAAGWWREKEVLLLAVVVLTTFTARLAALPVCGEESRWANGAKEMIATGDWIVPRQQGHVFPERPPLGSWMMGLTALALGHMGPLAIRLPSVLAALATSILIYGYARTFLTRVGALGAAGAYVTFGQVLQLCQLGESESLFTFLLSGALLVWHWGYACGWSAGAMWIGGYLLAGMAALDKGPQAPVYFVAVTGMFLVLRGEWRRLASWSHLAGIAVFLVVVGAWQIPFCLATEWDDVRDIWSGLALDRFKWEGLALHMLSYPWETLACLFPWSPLLVAYAFPHFRRSLGPCRPQLAFLLTAICFTYPSVWISAGARGRYFMPLYPCIALLVGIVVERWAASVPSKLEGLAWRRLPRIMSLVFVILGLVTGVAPLTGLKKLQPLRQPAWFGLGYTLVAIAVFVTFFLGSQEKLPRRLAASRWARWARTLSPQAALLTLVALLGITQTGVLVNLRLNKSNDLTPIIAHLRKQLPPGTQLVSFGPIAHRFAYYYDEPIREARWPEHADETAPGVIFFCFDLHAGDNNWYRSDGRGRRWAKTSAMLPFAWEPVASIPCDPMRRSGADMTVIVGRITGPLDPPLRSYQRVVWRNESKTDLTTTENVARGGASDGVER